MTTEAIKMDEDFDTRWQRYLATHPIRCFLGLVVAQSLLVGTAFCFLSMLLLWEPISLRHWLYIYSALAVIFACSTIGIIRDLRKRVLTR